MKKTILFSLLMVGAAVSQTLSPPKNYLPINSDTTNPASVMMWQIPPYTGSAKLRSMTWTQLVNGIGAATDTGCFTPCQEVVSDSIRQLYNNTPPGAFAGTVFGAENVWSSDLTLDSLHTLTMVLAGNSTISGVGITDSRYLLQNLLSQYLVQGGVVANVINDGVSGINCKELYTTYLAGQIAQNPRVYYLRCGVNDGYNNRDSVFHYVGLIMQTLRAWKSVKDLTIIISTPVAANDSVNGRDSTWLLSLNAPYRALARQYKAAFIDTWTLFRQPYTGPWDTVITPPAYYNIHPTNLLNARIAKTISDLLLAGVGDVVGTNKLKVPLSTYHIALETEAPDATGTNAYPVFNPGISVQRATAGWYYNGAVTTIKQPDGVSLQLQYPFASDGLMVRTGSGTTWNNWKAVLTANNAGVIDAGPFTNPSFATNLLVNNSFAGGRGFGAINTSADPLAYAFYYWQNDAGAADGVLTSSTYNDPGAFGTRGNSLQFVGRIGEVAIKARGTGDAALVAVFDTALTTLFGDLDLDGSITTGAPTTGTAAPFKSGVIVTAACVLDAAHYWQGEVNGVFVKRALCQ